MKSIREKVAYLQGMTKGMEYQASSQEGKLLIGMIDVLESVADEIECLADEQDDLENYVQAIDEDLGCLEDDLLEEDVEDDFDLVEMECPRCHQVVQIEEELVDEAEDIEVSCPTCGHVVYDSEHDAALHYRQQQYHRHM